MTENKAGSSRLKRLEPIHEEAAKLLMQRGSVDAVAKEIGVHPSTLSNWKKSSRFREYYRKLRHEAFDEAVAVLQAASLAASAKLANAMNWDDPANLKEGGRPDLALQAARAVLDLSDKWAKEVDVVERLETLERKAKKRTA